jgi:hypothetical protein
MLIHKNQTLDDIYSLEEKVSSSEDLFSSSISKIVQTYDCFWSKQDDGIKLPIFIVASSVNLETLFADVSTFHQNTSPLSAYTYICPKEIADQFLLGQKKSQPRLKYEERKIKIDISLILAETITATILAKKDLTTANIGYAACAQTLAASIARSNSLYPKLQLEIVSDRWKLARKLTNQDESAVSPQLVLKFSNSINNQSQKSHPAISFAQNEISEKTLQDYFVEKFNLRNESTKMKEIYNARISVFNSIVEKIEHANEPLEVKSACIAYYCNRILPGSINHAASLKNYIEKYPDIVFWYTAFACLSHEFDIRSAMSGICLKLSRDILKPFSTEERPSCDVSIDELNIIARVSMKASTLKPKGQRSVIVCLLPGVDIELPLGAQATANGLPQEMPEANRIDNQKLKSLLYDAIDILNKTSQPRNRSEKYKNRSNEGPI